MCCPIGTLPFAFASVPVLIAINQYLSIYPPARSRRTTPTTPDPSPANRKQNKRHSIDRRQSGLFRNPPNTIHTHATHTENTVLPKLFLRQIEINTKKMKINQIICQFEGTGFTAPGPKRAKEKKAVEKFHIPHPRMKNEKTKMKFHLQIKSNRNSFAIAKHSPKIYIA